MGGFLSLYDETDRVDLGGGYYVDVKRHLSGRETARATRALVDPRIESTVAGEGDGNVRSVTTVVDQETYNVEVMVAAILDWNLTDRDGSPLPLPPYIAGKSTGDDPANRVRRESIQALPSFAIKKVLKQISDNEKAGADTAAFPGEGDGAPGEA